MVQSIIDFRRECQDHYRNTAFDVPFPTLNLGQIFGGDSPNRICGECELHIDMRPLPEMDMNQLRHALRHKVKQIAQERGLACDFKALFDGVPAMCSAVRQ